MKQGYPDDGIHHLADIRNSFKKLGDGERSLSPIFKHNSTRNLRQRQDIYDNWMQHEAIGTQDDLARQSNPSSVTAAKAASLRQKSQSPRPVMQMGALAKSISDLEKFKAVYN